jgi:hypothetical protein
MNKPLTTGVALATMFAALASPAFAAPPKHRAPVANDTMVPHVQPPSDQVLGRPSDVVITEGRVVGADPDPNIRTQLMRDLDQAGF